MDENGTANPRLGTGGLREFVTFRIARVQAKLNAQASHVLKKNAGLTLVQWRIIFVIADLGVTSSNVVCKATAMDKGLVSRKLKNLVQLGLVQSRTKEGDHRQHLLSLTDEGAQVYRKTLPIMQRRQKHLLSHLSEEETEILARILDKIETATSRVDF